MGIEPTTSGLDLPLLWRLSYEVGQRKSGTIWVVNHGEEKVKVHNLHCRVNSLFHHLCSYSLLAEALFLLFADGRKETSAMGRKWL